ncbi:hypothetical protein [Streptomyces ortus]|uniref:Uncharacterized protein n=1 Tax=Streptomyces ortus TaxID=2867268 RepID=A0ABT3V412_9ACTN|nr:hypothetical protein [Streptomyces ortus]MCX4234702.1 hypothetical protein [Streptomyces ortus]
MNQQHPQQPGWGQPPQQPGWGTPPPPPKKNSAGKIIGFGCVGVFSLFVILGIFSWALGSDDESKDTKSGSASDTAAGEAAAEPKKDAPAKTKKEEASQVVFKVWGNAPAGSLGPLDITYGSDTDTRKGTFKDGSFEATLPLDDDALYFNVMAQLQGSGDINCSVTIDGHAEKAHAAGGYNICNAQANKGILGGWD